MQSKQCLFGEMLFIGSVIGGGGVIEFLLLLLVNRLFFIARLYKYLTGMAEANDYCEELTGLVVYLRSIMLVV
jgi:hypothetical protein